MNADAEMCEIIFGYKVGVLCGTTIYGHRNTQKARDEVVASLNAKKLDGIILSERVGGCGHNLVGANHTYFMGSLYSQSYEDQVNGTLVCCSHLIFKGRTCREGQTLIPESKIIANPSFIADSVPMNIKRTRGEGHDLLRKRLTEGEYRTFGGIDNMLIQVEKDRHKYPLNS